MTLGAMKGAAVGLGVAGTAATAYGIKSVSAYEQSTMAFEVMLKSQSKAQTMLTDLQKFAAETPFRFEDVQVGAQKLLAMGYAAKDIQPMLRTLGDAASSGIVPMAEGMSRLTYAFGQIKATGRVQGDELRQLYEMGIPALEMLAEASGKTAGQVQKDITDGLVPADGAIKALTEGLNKRYGGLMERQSKTLGGRWSNFMDVVQKNTRLAFTPLGNILRDNLPAWSKLAEKALLALGRGMTTWLPKAEVLAKRVATAIRGFIAERGGVSGIWMSVKGLLSDIASIWTHSIAPALSDLRVFIPMIVGGLMGLREIIRFAADHPDALKTVVEGVAIAIVGSKVISLVNDVVGGMKAWRTATLATAAAHGVLNATILANPIGLIVVAVAAAVYGLQKLYNKLNEGRPAWEGWVAALVPGVGILMTIENKIHAISGAAQSMKTLLGLDGKKQVEKRYIPAPKSYPGYFPGMLIPEPAKANPMPKLATGGTATRAGAALVGERGPEIIHLNKGASVVPLPQGEGASSIGPRVVFEDGAIRVSGSDVLNAQRTADILVAQIQDRLARR
jgi:tape measure domain-containing protein